VATRYKQPSPVNGVSAGLVLLVGLTAWLGLSAWPIIAVNSGVKNEIGEALPLIYRANLRDEPAATVETTRLHDELEAKIRALGVTDPALVIEISRSAKKVAIEVRYHATATLKGIGKQHTFVLHPRVETDAARVEW
jgi:hypothetical protein